MAYAPLRGQAVRGVRGCVAVIAPPARGSVDIYDAFCNGSAAAVCVYRQRSALLLCSHTAAWRTCVAPLLRRICGRCACYYACYVSPSILSRLAARPRTRLFMPVPLPRPLRISRLPLGDARLYLPFLRTYRRLTPLFSQPLPRRRDLYVSRPVAATIYHRRASTFSLLISCFFERPCQAWHSNLIAARTTAWRPLPRGSDMTPLSCLPLL